jgi:hypothetical protein
MKTNKTFFTVLGFLTGMVFGVSIVGLLAFTNAQTSTAPAGGLVPISAADAHACLTRYSANAVSFNQVIKGFTLDKSQIEAMNSISRENPDLSGFRIYMGVDKSSRKIGIVVGVDNTGKDAVKNTIYTTDLKNLSPCPPICDASSPIVMD